MRIAYDELIPDGDEVARVRFCWSRMEADHVGAALAANGIDFAEEHDGGGWSIYTAASDLPRVTALLERLALDRTESIYNAGL